MIHHYKDLITLFAQCFEAKWNTKLVHGGEEPMYLPRNETRPYHLIIFRHDYYSSALHEIAHWLIAGHARRQREDYGYWYYPDGRTQAQQAQFFLVESKPQALEWILSQAAGVPFHISLDNLTGSHEDSKNFEEALHQQVMHYRKQGLPPRAKQFRDALENFYGTIYP